MIWMKNQSRQENLAYLVAWSLLFATPLLSLYLRTTNDPYMEFNWQEVFFVWGKFSIFLGLFLIHNFLLAPLLIHSHKRIVYFSIVTALMAGFIVLQCTTRPKGVEKRMRFHHERMEQRAKEQNETFPPDFEDFEKFREGGPEMKRRHTPPLFVGEHDVLRTMEMITTFEQSITESVKSAASYRFMAQVTNYMFDEDLKKERKRFDSLNFKSGEGGGLLLFNANVKEIKQLEAAKNLVDKDQQELIEKNVWRYFGVSEAVIMNTAKPDELSSFFEGEIEPFAIKMSDGLSGMIYSERELSAGNKAMLTANRLQYMSVPDKVSLSQQLGDRGAILIDEIRDMFNFPPLPDGAGQHAPIRGEYYMVDEGRPDNMKTEEKKDAE